MLSKNSTKILKELKKKEIKYQKKENMTSKTSYHEIKELFPNHSFISISMILKYLMHEKYIYNHIAGKENNFDIKDVEKNTAMFVIGEKGLSYLENRKYVLMAKIIPIVISVISLIISFINLLFFK